MSEIQLPFESKQVIDELVEFQETHKEPRDLLTHIAGTWKPGRGKITWFFAQVHEDLRTDKCNKYATLSSSELKQFLENEYLRLAKERIVLAKAKDNPKIPYSYNSYENYCWKCKWAISSEVNRKCQSCGGYICRCGACFCKKDDFGYV